MENANKPQGLINAAISRWPIISPVISFLKDRFSIIDLANPDATIEGIKKDIEFRGFSLWILIFSIFIASIGLNVNSTAVVIGAMLISPLMGPIMGLGLSLGINDFKLLTRSLKNLGVAIGIGLLVSAFYFLVSPISTPSNELFTRTNPTLLDVLVAFFGGLAGILAGSRKEKNNVIPGVAIATALMPPLCTAGYGLAHGDWHYFFGALYLFLINAVLIATSTTLIVRYLRFPLKEILDPLRAKKSSRYFTIGLIIIIVPSIYIMYRTVTDSINQGKIETYLVETVDYPGTEILKEKVAFNNGTPEVTLVLFGDRVPVELADKWSTAFSKKFSGKLTIVQDEKEAQGLEEMSKMVQLYSEGRDEARSFQEKISFLEGELIQLEQQLIPANLTAEIRINYPELERFSIGTLQYGIDSISDGSLVPVAFVNWKADVDSLNLSKRNKQLENWLKLRLEKETVLVQPMP